MEAKGKQDLWIQRKPEILDALREQAIIQSVESSNRIEGVTVEPNRLRPIVLGRSKPRDRSEIEIVGYKRALKWIFNRKRLPDIDADIIRKLHSYAQGGSASDAGQWKQKNNEIIEILPNNERKIRFKPTSARKTPKAIDQLCLGYRDVIAHERLPALIAVASYVFDFLCIHPFRDGNGRISRLLAFYLLEQHGLIVGRFISLERLIEANKEAYYQTLSESSSGWHEGRNDLTPWWNYFLSIVNQAYGEFAKRVEFKTTDSGKSELIMQSILRQAEPFSLAEISNQCPNVSVQLIKKVLAKMKKEGTIRLSGRGRGAKWSNVKYR
jgi:Fic family protein